MGFRSGFTLVQLLKSTREMTNAAEVHRHIDAAMTFINGNGAGYQKGRPLVDCLEAASRAASDGGEHDLADRLAHFAGYAEGRIPLMLLESKYDPRAKDRDDKFMRVHLEYGLVRCAEILEEFLKDRADASGQELHQWLVQVTQAMEAWTIGEDTLPRVKLPRYTADQLTWFRNIQLVLNGGPEGSDLTPEVAEKLAGVPGAELVARAVQWRSRKDALDRLRAVVEDPESSEAEIHAELKRQTWIFGGRYVREHDRRRLTLHDELDIPLIRGDGSFHVVELKKAIQPRLVMKPRSHCTVGAVVHEAVTQAANYLRTLDEHRHTIFSEERIDVRRASATVLIGHPMFVEKPFTAADISEALRTYNAVLTRIEVMTYEELIDAAERTLALNDADV